MKRALKIALQAIILIVGLVLIYVIGVLISYHRLPDNISLDIEGEAKNEYASTNTEYELTSWNIGFAAYLQDYGFFMDGGTESRAYSKGSVNINMENISNRLKEFDSDFYFIQEVDFDSTRSYHVDERIPLAEALGGDNERTYTFAQNYDSVYLFYPIFEPHGKSKSGILTFSRFDITDSLRRSLPIETTVRKLVDLDRCYSINRVPVDNGKELILINFHLSAYASDPKIVTNQIIMLNEEIRNEYEKGNYVIAGGDFNKDILGDSSVYFGIPASGYSWAKSFPMALMPVCASLVAPLDKDNPVATCRNADGPYDKETQLQVSVDGFIVTDNVEVISATVIDTEFENSDHNPVQLTFKLN